MVDSSAGTMDRLFSASRDALEVRISRALRVLCRVEWITIVAINAQPVNRSFTLSGSKNVSVIEDTESRLFTGDLCRGVSAAPEPAILRDLQRTIP